MSGLPERIVLASANPKKAAEMADILGRLGGAGSGADGGGIDVLPRPDDVPDVVEDAPDFEGNARLKAAALVAATGLPALADDSGLEVDALDGAPGVRSARYAGEGATDADNVVKLLAELDRVGAVDPSARTARFRTVIVLAFPDGTELVTAGRVEGVIEAEPRGTAGFGYDPVFRPVEGDGRTFAELSAQDKHAISHRGRALRDLAERLRPR